MSDCKHEMMQDLDGVDVCENCGESAFDISLTTIAELEAELVRSQQLRDSYMAQILTLEAERDKLQEAAQAAVDVIGSMEFANESIKALAALLEKSE